MLPRSSHEKVIKLIDDLLQMPDVEKPKKKAAAWEEWANSHSQNVVLHDDSRQSIY